MKICFKNRISTAKKHQVKHIHDFLSLLQFLHLSYGANFKIQEKSYHFPKYRFQIYIQFEPEMFWQMKGIYKYTTLNKPNSPPSSKQNKHITKPNF